MSAFMVSDAHIDALVTFAVRHQVSYRVNGSRIDVTKNNAEEIGQILVDENYRSLNARYSERTEEYFGKAPTYRTQDHTRACGSGACGGCDLKAVRLLCLSGVRNR